MQEAELEKVSLIQQMENFQQARITNQAIIPESNGGDNIIVPPTMDSDQTRALMEEEERLKLKLAETEGLQDTLRLELELLDKAPERVITQNDILNDSEIPSTPRRRRNSLNHLPGGKFASKWNSVERTYSVDHINGTPSDSNVQPSNLVNVAVEGELEPVQDLFSDFLSATGKVFQFILESMVFIIAVVGTAIGKCLESYKDAQIEQKEQKIRHRTRSTGRYKASAVKERFSSPIQLQQQNEHDIL